MRILIVGAGIAGNTLAWFLAKTGAQITVVEKSSSLLRHGQSVDLEGSAVTIIKKMGLLDEVRRFNTTEKGSQFIDSKGRPFASFPVREGFGASLSSELEILRGDLAAILYEASKVSPNVEYLFDTTIKEVVSNDQDAVKVRFRNEEVHEYDLLVAADGQWSKVRRQCFPPESVTVVDMGMYVGYWTVPRIPSDNEWCHIYLALGSKVIALRPDPHGTVRAICSRVPQTDLEKEAWKKASKNGKEAQEKILRKDFEDAGWQAQRFLDAVDQSPDFYFHAIQQIRMAKWSINRVICLGDAAYAPTPLTGAGTSLAIIGAYVLAGELSKSFQAEHPSKAFESYESTFRPYVEHVQKIPPFVPGIAHPNAAWKRWLLHTAIWALSKVLSRISKIPRLAKYFDRVNKEDFPLPRYPRFDTETAQSTTPSHEKTALNR